MTDEQRLERIKDEAIHSRQAVGRRHVFWNRLAILLGCVAIALAIPGIVAFAHYASVVACTRSQLADRQGLVAVDRRYDTIVNTLLTQSIIHHQMATPAQKRELLAASRAKELGDNYRADHPLGHCG